MRYLKGSGLPVLVLLLFSGTFLFAAPYQGDTLELELPDKSLVKVKAWGDEYYLRVESLDGYTLTYDKACA